MNRRLLLSCFVVGALGVGSVSAHHTGKTHPIAKVQITQSVLAGGKPLAPGTYEVWISDERPATPSGTPSENQRWVEIAADGKVVAREIAEVFPSGERDVVGTSGSSSAATARVEPLKDGDFVRVAVNDAGARYLIYLPTGKTGVQP